jgi:predicted signal transduction protein with EAL and GGDEF domain/CheY-like chemotaxis protein
MTDMRNNILVVDDEVDACLVMRAALRKAGFEVGVVHDGEAALAEYHAGKYDLVMLDVDMPGMSGYEVCARLRAEAGPLLPIVMVTGMDDVQSVQTAYQQGATDFIPKPINWGLIGHRVLYLLRAYQTLVELRAAEARNEAVLSAIPDQLFELTDDGRCLNFRTAANDPMAGLGGAIIGKRFDEFMPGPVARVWTLALRDAAARGSSSGQQYELETAGGTLWFEMSVSHKTDKSADGGRFVVLSRNVTERKETEIRIERLAYFDNLTGLANRHSFLERVDREVQRARRRRNQLAVLFMDLDGFKNVNDTMGHAAGDQILKRAAERLQIGLRPSDVVSRPVADGPASAKGANGGIEIARLGGDEFTALVMDMDRPEDALAVAQRIGEIMRRPFALEGREVVLTASIGIALFPTDGEDAATLLKHADTAMYQAKGSGRDNAQMYNAALTTDVLARMELEASLRNAVTRNEFFLTYQPQIDTQSGTLCAVEALIRWNHPQRGLISPMEFIPLAEQRGLIDQIGQWALHSACEQAARWARCGSPLRVAVNLSPLQFRNPDITQTVLAILADTGLAPQWLELEVTEGALMENSASARAALELLRDNGVRIALDDFGTGYSSLAYLTRMPIYNIKIDKCFVNGLMGGGENEAIIRAVLAMAHSLGMRVTAEGVETREQAQMLKLLGCDTLQGYYFSRPVLADNIPALLSKTWDIAGATPAPLERAYARPLATAR